MKRKICLFALTLTLLVSSFPLFTLVEVADAATAQMQAAVAEAISMLEEEREEGVIVVFMEEGVTPEQAQELFVSLDILNDLDDRDICRSRNYDYFSTDKIRFALVVPEERIVEILVKLNLSEIVDRACPNYIITFDDWEDQWTEKNPSAIADSGNSIAEASYDPYTTQWAMQQIQYANSWEADRTILVGVLDTGYNPHNDVNCVDMERARNYYDQENLYDVKDSSGHGTFIVGQIGATLDGKGVNGVCKNVTIVPIKVGENSSYYFAVCDGIEYAEQEEIKVLNLSCLLTEGLCNDLRNVTYTGVLVIAAGNCAENVENPCKRGYSHGHDNAKSNWIIVGATTSTGDKRSSSNYSKKYVHLFAPGDNIKGIGKNKDDYVTQSGTSMAAPFVTAAAAILLKANPFLKPEEIRTKLIDTVTKKSSLTNYCVSGGILNLAAATDSLYSDQRDKYSLGDIDGEGDVTSTDYMLLKRYVMGTYTLNSNAMRAADINNDSKVNSTDYLLVKRFVSKEYYFPPYHVD